MYLGFVFDNKFNWKDQVQSIANKTNKKSDLAPK